MKFRKARPFPVAATPSLTDVAGRAAAEIVGFASDCGYAFRPDHSTRYAIDLQRLEDEIRIWLEFHMIQRNAP